MIKEIKKLNIEEKIKLFQELYSDITDHGKNGDVHLAHINEYERKLLIAHGGCGTVNDETGLTQYFGGGGSGGGTTPDTTTTFAREAPEIEARKIALFDRATALAQQPRNIPAYQVATPGTMEQLAFDRGISQLGVGQDTTNQAIAASQGASQTALGAPNISQFLNPMNSFVIDEITRQAGIQQNQISADAIKSGAFGGGREGAKSRIRWPCSRSSGSSTTTKFWYCTYRSSKPTTTCCSNTRLYCSTVSKSCRQQQTMAE